MGPGLRIAGDGGRPIAVQALLPLSWIGVAPGTDAAREGSDEPDVQAEVVVEPADMLRYAAEGKRLRAVVRGGELVMLVEDAAST